MVRIQAWTQRPARMSPCLALTPLSLSFLLCANGRVTVLSL